MGTGEEPELSHPERDELDRLRGGYERRTLLKEQIGVLKQKAGRCEKELNQVRRQFLEVMELTGAKLFEQRATIEAQEKRIKELEELARGPEYPAETPGTLLG